MAKNQSFAQKIAKSAGQTKSHCPECGEAFRSLHVIDTVRNERDTGYKFQERYMRVCKCNENELKS
ncbi:MAG: hypothetical protein U5R06_14625 [candidate division KSB1 bacterium]|nr:hypothetical protein [candidate division KSB1 bacterium]